VRISPPRPPQRRPQNGTQAHDLSPNWSFRAAQVGATPFWDRRRAASRTGKETRKCEQLTWKVLPMY